MANIRVDVNYAIQDGSEVVFRSPVDCSQITGLIVYYTVEGKTASKVFALADAHGNNVGDIDHLFAESVVVKVILDVTAGMAYVQNADTNAYLEGRFVTLESKVEELINKPAASAEIFIAEYGVTTYEEILSAVNEKKACFAYVDNTHLDYPVTFPLAKVRSDGIAFSVFEPNNQDLIAVRVTADNTWSMALTPYKIGAPLIDEAFDDYIARVGVVRKYVDGLMGGSTNTTQEQNVLVVQLSFSTGTGYTADRTYNEIVTAYDAGKMVLLRYEEVSYVLTRQSHAGSGYSYTFKRMYEDETLISGGSSRFWEITVSRTADADTWKLTSDSIPYATDTVTNTAARLPTSKAVYDFVMAQLEAMPNAAEVGY